MEIPESIVKSLENLCDYVFSLIPQKTPTIENLKKCKIISHRGQHDNIQIIENTIIAFDKALKIEGVWGIEFDFRWTKDIHPVVIHDQNLLRLYGSKTKISETTLSELKKKFPLIPTLKEVVNRYGGKLHLMVEAKEEHNYHSKKKDKILKEIFERLEPNEDYHLLALSPKILELIRFVEDKSKILVAIFNENYLSKISLKKKYAGIGGHFLLLNKKIVRKHLKFGQKIGVGYPKSKNSLFREINRGIEWIFCNDSEKLCYFLKNELKKNNSKY